MAEKENRIRPKKVNTPLLDRIVRKMKFLDQEKKNADTNGDSLSNGTLKLREMSLGKKMKSLVQEKKNADTNGDSLSNGILKLRELLRGKRKG